MLVQKLAETNRKVFAGNLATEDLLYMLQGMGAETGIDLHKVVQASQVIAKALNRVLPGRYLQAQLGQSNCD